MLQLTEMNMDSLIQADEWNIPGMTLASISPRYETEVNCPKGRIRNEDYHALIHSLSLRQSALCAHMIQWIHTRIDPMQELEGCEFLKPFFISY